MLFIGSKIGEGAHGKVYKGRIVEIKVFHRGSKPEEKSSLDSRFIREVNMMSRVKHENLVKFAREETVTEMMTAETGTYRWMAPEGTKRELGSKIESMGRSLDANTEIIQETGREQLASHGLFDVHVKATGDVYIDDHHSNEDIDVAIGTAVLKGLTGLVTLQLLQIGKRIERLKKGKAKDSQSKVKIKLLLSSQTFHNMVC